MASEIRHGWYSAAAANLWGYVTYLNDAGEEVHITMQSEFEEGGETYFWEDKVYVGILTKYVRSVDRSYARRDRYTSNYFFKY